MSSSLSLNRRAHRFILQAGFAARRPDLAVRRLRGLATIEITPDEIREYLPRVRTIVEAGALDGSDTVRLATAYPAATIYAFEPVPTAFDQAARTVASFSNVTVLPFALSDRSGPTVIHISSGIGGASRPDSSSLLQPSGHLTEMPSVMFESQLEVPAVTLDDWAVQNSQSAVDLLWLDLQGMELPVLKAATKVVAGCQAVMMEVSRVELYAGSALYPEVTSWMRDAGFTLKIDRVSRLFGNALFVR